MTVIGKQRSYHKKFAFKIEIDGIANTGFQKCSELSVEAAKVEQWEGGAIIPNKSPGRLTMSDVTLEFGSTKDFDVWQWMKQVADAVAGTGAVDPEYKRTLDIIQLDRDGSEIRRWTLTNAWPTKFVAGEWDNTVDENLIQSVTLTYDSFDDEAAA
jgi:phage tail-like protein